MRDHGQRPGKERYLAFSDSVGCLLALLLLSACSGCSDDPAGVERDSPMIEIVFPTAEAFDRDGDALVDIEVLFEDMGSGIDIESLEIVSSRALGPLGQGGTDVLATFEVAETDSTWIVLEETTDALLPGGEVNLLVRVRDRAGNLAEEQRAVMLPFGAFHRLLEGPDVLIDPIGIEMAPDGSRGFLLPPAFESDIVPFDPFTLEVLPGVSSGGVEDLVDGELDSSGQRFFSVGISDRQLSVFEIAAMQAEAPIPISSTGIGIERAPSGLLYVALVAQRASIGVIDPVARTQLRVIQTDVTNTLNPQEPAFVRAPRFLGGEARFFVPMGVPPGGVLVVDNDSGNVESVIDINPSSQFLGLPLDSALDEARGRLYLTDFDGLAEVNLATEELERRIDAGGLRPKFLSMSPSGDRLFMSAGTAMIETESWLVDVESFSILERFSIVELQPGGENKSVFRPDGQLIFATREDDIAVYLNRE
jgi:hypothetical protein